ncbi:BrnA antitoxin family protein [Falsiroseomonas sp. E2-1-a20]|uniref:BrnA antitoxin family protein n=1 Tax=Falsiroseomonas sp. E2-1-a20 TaxID=3239300 RepID=UPI003F4023B2
MRKDENIKSYSADELRAMRARGESRSDWARVDAMSEAELERAIAVDPDWKDIPADWHEHALPVVPNPKKLLSLRIDADIVEYFRSHGPGYQTWMNAVLRAYVTARQKAPPET